MQFPRYVILAHALTAATPTAAVEVLGTNWSGAGEFGYVATSGNTDTQSMSAKISLANERARWRHTLNLDALNSSDSDTTTAERYAGDWQTDYKFTEFDYIFGRLSHETDKFSGYDYRSSETAGYGRRVLRTESVTLDLEAGLGARQSKLMDDGTEHETIGRFAGRYAWQISPNAKLTEKLSTEIGGDATVTRSVTALQADIIGNLAVKLSYTVENTSDVPPGTKKTDTETMASLVYKF